MKVGMSSLHCHTVTRNCDHAQVKMHTVAELLLLAGPLRQIKTENIDSVQMSLITAREQINSSLSIVLEIINDIVKSMGDFKGRWKVICDMLYRLSDAVTVLVELCYHVTYRCLSPGSLETSPDILIDKYATAYAGLEIKLSCLQLKRARVEELTATFIMDICSNISKYISILTDNCRNGSDGAPDAPTRDQFKLGIKSVTCAAGSVIASIKLFKGDKSSRHHTRVVTFCEPVLAASHALVCLATEEEFIDKGKLLSDEDKEIQKSVFGPCMNIVSGCVQICKVLRDFTYDTGNSHYAHKVKSCHSSVLKSTNQLKYEMQKHFRMDFQVKSSSPIRPEDHSQTPDKIENNRELSPFSRKSPQPGGKEDDHSPRSSMAPSDITFSMSSLSI